MDKVILSESDLQYLLKWRDEHKDLARDLIENGVGFEKEDKKAEWEEVKDGKGIFDYRFKCKDCGAVLPKGFVVSPDYCPYCIPKKEVCKQ